MLLAIMDSAHIRSHSEKGPERPVVPPDHGRDGETVSPSPQSNSQTSAGIFQLCLVVLARPIRESSVFDPIDVAAHLPLTRRTGLGSAFHRLTTRTLQRA